MEVGIILAVIGIVLQLSFLFVEKKEKYLQAVILKGLASLMFVMLGFCSVSSGNFSKWILAGLIFGMAGDILLNMKYLAGENGKKCS